MFFGNTEKIKTKAKSIICAQKNCNEHKCRYFLCVFAFYSEINSNLQKDPKQCKITPNPPSPIFSKYNHLSHLLSLSLCFSLSLLPSFPRSLFLSFIHLIVISLLPSLLWKCLFVFVFKVLVVLKSIGQLFYTVSPVGVCPIFAQDCIQSMFFWDRNIREVVSCLSECTTSGGTRLSCSV